MIQHLIWIVGSIIIGVLQNLLVLYNAVIILIEITATQVTKLCRVCLRWVSIPWPSVWKRKRRMWELLRQMRSATSFDSFLTAARELDALEGSDAWRAERESDEYDYELLEATTKRLRKNRRHGNIQALAFDLRTTMSRSYGAIDNPALYRRAYCGTKQIVEKYMAECVSCLEAVANSNELSDDIKLEFFETCRLSIGRTALALSGGGALAMSHMGVVRTLIQCGLLPRVISGTSGGSIVAAMMAMHTDEQLLRDVLVPDIVDRFRTRFFDPISVQLVRFVRTSLLLGAPRMMDSELFESTVKAFYGEETFGSAFATTGRIVNITITVHYGGSSFPQPLVLNYLTAPAVLLWSAVAASCALPGLMRPVTLMAKNHDGHTVPYHPVSGVKSIDGSMHSDIPAEQMALMFHCNRTIVSQANPHVVPFLKDVGPKAHIDTNVFSRVLYAIEYWLTLDIQSRTKYLSKMRLLPKFFGAEFSNVFLQRYTGDVTIAPHQPFLSQWKALSQPSESDMATFIMEGQRATWPHITHIRTLVAIEKKLSACARRFGHVPGIVFGGPRAAPRGVRHAKMDPEGSKRGVQAHTMPAIDDADDEVVQEASTVVSAGGGPDERRSLNVGPVARLQPIDDPASSGEDDSGSSVDDDTDGGEQSGSIAPRGSSPTLLWRHSSRHAVSYGNLSNLGGTSVLSSGKKNPETLVPDEDDSVNLGSHFSSGSAGPRTALSFLHNSTSAATGLSFASPNSTSEAKPVRTPGSRKSGRPGSVTFVVEDSPEQALDRAQQPAIFSDDLKMIGASPTVNFELASAHRPLNLQHSDSSAPQPLRVQQPSFKSVLQARLAGPGRAPMTPPLRAVAMGHGFGMDVETLALESTMTSRQSPLSATSATRRPRIQAAAPLQNLFNVESLGPMTPTNNNADS